jgi:hypothetical protein
LGETKRAGGRTRRSIFSAVQKVIAVNIIPEVRFTFDSPKDEMMEGARHVEEGFSGHAGRVGEISLLLPLRSPSDPVGLGIGYSHYASSLLYPNFTHPENILYYRILVWFSAKFPEHFPKATLYVSLDQILPPSSLSKENVYIFPTVSDRNLGAAIPFP